jgi:hypothetical protein
VLAFAQLAHHHAGHGPELFCMIGRVRLVIGNVFRCLPVIRIRI